MGIKQKYYITAFYRFINFSSSELLRIQPEFEAFCSSQKICGLIIFSPEGLNGTLASPNLEAQANLKKYLEEKFALVEDDFKDSEADFRPFRRLAVQVRDEIIKSWEGVPIPETKINETHLEPEEWEALLNNSPEDVVVVDTRNDYESTIGKFKNALCPDIKNFQELPAVMAEYFEQGLLPKEKKVLMYCTGGVRCEKAALDLKKKGISEVYQLRGGILRYLEKFPNSNFEGECFVFDNRVAVGQHLEASKQYKLCPHCGQPGMLKITCLNCESDAVICELCASDQAKLTCSKNCCYHYNLRKRVKGAVPVSDQV